MIQSILVFDNNGNPIITEATGRISLNESTIKFASSIAEMVGWGSPQYGYATLREIQIHYVVGEDFSVMLSSNIQDSPESLKQVLVEIWDSTTPLLRGQKFELAEKAALDIILQQAIKIAVFGRGGVGKTTIAKMIMREVLPLKHIPTIGVEIRLVPEGFLSKSKSIVLWDIAGQSKFQSLWPLYLRDAHLVLVVTDSSLENVLWTRRFLPSLREWAQNATIVGVANKQDLPIALTKERVESILGIETEGLEALEFTGNQHTLFKDWIVGNLGLV